MGEKKIKMCQKKDESIKKVLEEIEDKAIESRYTNMYDWQRRELSKHAGAGATSFLLVVLLSWRV